MPNVYHAVRTRDVQIVISEVKGSKIATVSLTVTIFRRSFMLKETLVLREQAF